MKIIEPCTLAILGAGGNLSQRKLIPALFRLEVSNRLPEKMVILGCDIVLRTGEEWLSLVTEILHGIYSKGIDEIALERFCRRWKYFAIPPGDDSSYARLQGLLDGNSGFCEGDTEFPPVFWGPEGGRAGLTNKILKKN